MKVRIRKAVENDLGVLRKLVRDTRMEHFKEAIKTCLVYSMKIQILFLMISLSFWFFFDVNILVVHITIVAVVCVIYYFYWQKKVFEISMEMEDWESFTEVYFSSPFSTFLVATNSDGEIIGCVGLRHPQNIVSSAITRFKLSPSSVEIVKLGVVEKYRGQKIATKLMKACEDFISRSESSRPDLLLETTHIQYSAILLYKKLKYELLETYELQLMSWFGILQIHVFVKKFK